MTKNVYIHIPFCRRKCNYCSFVSFADFSKKDEYINALISQIESEYKGEPLNTLYLGGGTPSILEACDIQKLINLFRLDTSAEVTIELNPESVSEDYISSLKESGVNRLSIGSQSFDDNILSLIGRKHSSSQISEAVQSAKNVGFDNISLDLIYGLPSQTMEIFSSDLEKVISQGVSHVSLYGLKIDEGCFFYNNPPSYLPDEDEQADMFLFAIDKLKSAGFSHYEVSNFAKSGFESRHNLNYWENNSYFGFGVSASGYVDGVRYTNLLGIDEYIKTPLKKEFIHKVEENERLEESIFLGLRKLEGIDISEINENFGIDFNQKYSPVINKYIRTGHIQKTQKGISLTKEGILISNDILSEFLD